MNPLQKRVLILDDERAQVRALKGHFARFQHGHRYELTSASTTAEAIEALKAGRPDLIIVEPEMESLDALQMLTALRQHDGSIPVIALSRGKRSTAAEAVFRLGVLAYVPKPCDYSQLEHLVALACPGRPVALGR